MVCPYIILITFCYNSVMKFRFDYILQRIHPHIAVDCGSSMTRMQFCPARGKIIEEPTVVVLNTQKSKVISYGKDAEQLVGKVSHDVSVIQPIRRGVVVDAGAIEKFMRQMIERVLGKYFLFKPSVIASIPSGCTPVEREVWEEVWQNLGIRQMYLVDQVLAGAIGAGVPVAQGSGNLVIHLGSDITEIALISLGRVVLSKTGKFGSNDVDREVQHLVRQQTGIHISLHTAEYVKKHHGLKNTDQVKQALFVSGQHVRQGRPQEVEISQNIVSRAMEKYVGKLHEMILELMEETPAELATDVIDKGFLLTGGGAQLRGLDQALTQLLDVPVSTADRPDQCVIHGMQSIFHHLAEYRQLVMGK